LARRTAALVGRPHLDRLDAPTRHPLTFGPARTGGPDATMDGMRAPGRPTGRPVDVPGPW
jgi:hypothetical protein